MLWCGRNFLKELCGTFTVAVETLGSASATLGISPGSSTHKFDPATI